MVTLRNTLLSGLGIGGLLSANFAFAQIDCTIPFDENGQVDLATLAQTLSACSDQSTDEVWFELVDRGTYQLEYSAPEGAENRRIIGISHVDWSQDIPLAVGTIFGFRAMVIADDVAPDATFDIVTHFPDGPNGPRPPEVTTKAITPGSAEAALFLIGSEPFLIPGE